jgi:hypothetical protein
MSDKKSLLGMDVLEWNSLAGLQDPYSLELAQLSAEVGVPNVRQPDELTEERKKPVTASEKRLAMMKHLHRSRRKGAAPDPEKVRAYEKGMKGVMAKAANEGVTRDEIWEALLYDHDLTLSQFDGLLDEALASEDEELAAELLALEDRLDEIAGALGAVVKGAQAVGSGVVKGAQAFGRGAKKGYDLTKGAAKVAQKGADVAGKGLDVAKAGADAAKGAAGAAPKPAAGAGAAAPKPAPGVPPAGNGGAAKPAVAAPAADPAAAAPASPGESPAAKKAPAPGAGTGQPGQAGAQKKPGLLKNVANLAKGVAKVGVGSAGITTGVAAAPVKGAAKIAKGAQSVKKPAAESFGEWLEQRGVTLEQYEALIDYAIEHSDIEEMDSLLALADLYEDWREMLGMSPKKTKLADPKKWRAARDVVAQHGQEKTKAASQRGRQVGTDDPKKKAASWRQGGGTSVSSAVEHYYHLVGRPITEG